MHTQPVGAAGVAEAIHRFVRDALAEAVRQPAADPVDVRELDQSLRLYTRSQLADLVGCDPSTVHRAIVDPASPLKYTHGRGRRRLIDYPTAKAWLDTIRLDQAR